MKPGNKKRKSNRNKKPRYGKPKIGKDDNTTTRLSKHSYSIGPGFPGVTRADGAYLGSNVPCEDRFNKVRTLTLDGTQWSACAVCDGHRGPQTAVYLEEVLLDRVQKKLAQLQPQSRTEAAVQKAIEVAFVDVDQEILQDYRVEEEKQLGEKMSAMMRAEAGSCALVVLYDPVNLTVYTACAGDSRAVLGQQQENGIWEAIDLSTDQNGQNEKEVARVQEEHPGETVIADERVFGMAVTRAFGDFSWKSTLEESVDLEKRFGIGGILSKDQVLTPPYLTATPVVTVQKLTGPAFLILGTDGLWEKCESHEAASLVIRWMEAQSNAAPTIPVPPESAWWVPATKPATSFKPRFDFLELWDQPPTDVRFTYDKEIFKDLDNVAVHLLRNALGGSHEELLNARLAVEWPWARQSRDDVTIQVIFLDW